MKKAIVATAAALAALAVSTMMGCGISVSSTITKSETVTDVNGNITTITTTSVKDSDGRRFEAQTTAYTADPEELGDKFIVADISFTNETGMDIAEMYFTSHDAEDWGNEILGEDAPLADGEKLTFYEAFSYNEECVLWNLCIVDEDGNSIEFNGLNVSEADDEKDIAIVIAYDEEADVFTTYVE